MRAEIISISNGSLQGSKISMVRGDTLEIMLRVLRDDNSPVLLNRFEGYGGTSNERSPDTATNHRLSMEFTAPLKDGGDIRVFYRTTQSARQILYGPTDELTVLIDQRLTRRLPAPMALNFDMQITEFIGEGRRMSTIYQGVLQVDKDITSTY
jgi:hypothetical protein